jgi:MFS transporter, Spinster family, sphingosine-1-phosphate transporter
MNDQSSRPNRYRWFVVGVFFMFMLLHQSDKLLIGPLLTDITKEFKITDAEAGLIGTGALLVGAVLFPLWGVLYDRFSRAKLLALASAIWGVTTWFSAVARSFPVFLTARASTGIDDSSYPGIYSLISDYFVPAVRGKVYGLLQLTAPLGYLIGLVLALAVAPLLGGWRGVFYLTGALGLVLAVVIFFGIREMPRGKSEPELADVPEATNLKFEWKAALGLLRKRSLFPLFAQGFFGVFPLNIFSFWFFKYLETERGYASNEVLPTMGIAVLMIAAGAFIGGSVGDWMFKRTQRGRLLVAAVAVLTATVLLVLTINVPNENKLLFGVMLAATGSLILWSGPNVISTVYDITVPEVRSTALSIQYFIEQAGAAAAPLLVGLLSDSLKLQGTATPLGTSILYIAGGTYFLCGLFLLLAASIVPRDIKALRSQLQQRADDIRAGRAAT